MSTSLTIKCIEGTILNEGKKQQYSLSEIRNVLRAANN